MIRLGRSVSQAIMKTVAETASDFVLFGSPGTSGAHGRLFGSVIDYVVANPPTDMGIVRVRPFDKLRRILVPVAGGPNGRLARSVATSLARETPEETVVTLLHVMPIGADSRAARARAATAFRNALYGNTFAGVEERIIEAATPLEGILAAAAEYDMIVIGATKEPLFRNLLMGNVAQRVTEQATVPVIVVKQRSPILTAMLRETVLSPIHRSPKLPEESNA
jgi:nucleotide-binding universal stress UspA family protein